MTIWRHIDRARLVYALRSLAIEAALAVAIAAVLVALQCIGGLP